MRLSTLRVSTTLLTVDPRIEIQKRLSNLELIVRIRVVIVELRNRRQPRIHRDLELREVDIGNGRTSTRRSPHESGGLASRIHAIGHDSAGLESRIEADPIVRSGRRVVMFSIYKFTIQGVPGLLDKPNQTICKYRFYRFGNTLWVSFHFIYRMSQS